MTRLSGMLCTAVQSLFLLSYLAGITQNIMLGIGAVVFLPLGEPVLVAKSAASIDSLSNGRLLPGFSLGDRTIEFPLVGNDYDGKH